MMDERSVLEKIKESARDLEVPDALKPEQIQKQLENTAGIKKRRRRHRSLAAAACLCLCFGLGSMAYRNHVSSQVKSGVDEYETGMKTGQNEPELEKHTDSAGMEEAAGDHDTGDSGSSQAAEPVKEAPLKKIGKMYTLASDYGEVYDVLKKSEVHGQVIKYEQKESAKAAADFEAERGTDFAGNMSMDAADDAAAAENTREFSSTNLQVEGVDESDIVKTDGSYIYVVQESGIQILDIRGGMPRKAAVIEPDMDADADSICEMYVADHRLTVILQAEQTELEVQEDAGQAEQTEPGVQEDAGQAEQEVREDARPAEETGGKELVTNMEHTQEQESMRNGDGQGDAAGDEAARKTAYDIAAADVQYIHAEAVTKVVSYDITDPQKPVLQNVSSQDGWYQTSRKIGNRLYLFTNKMLRLAENLARTEALKEESLSSWLPRVDGKYISADCIYLPKEGNDGLIMASLDLADHKVLDTKMLVNSSAQLYVSQNSVYLYYTDYANQAVRTRLARFELETDGGIRAIGAKTLKGAIEDTFAIHEREGCLQVLTSITSSDPWENRVYVLDENLKTVGRLTGLAKGERIYSARFVGSIGYFVTYRNTDPLFTVDFADPENPKVIGELKVTGFSEYLHFWGSDRLLGIGQETDPDSGEVTGVKLSMFDISDPAKVTEEAKFVMEDAQNCEAMYDYKSVLADLDKNIIVLITESYQNEYKEDFRVFSYVNGEFVSRTVRPLAAGNKDYEESRWRSLFAGDMLYLVSEKKTITFDMKQGWKEIGKLVYAR